MISQGGNITLFEIFVGGLILGAFSIGAFILGLIL